jgi:hypothetical protein
MAKNLTDDDIILNYLLDKKDEHGKAYTLSKPQEAKLERLFDCDALAKSYPKKHDVLNMMVSKYKHIYEGNYSKRVAINDYNSCMYIFGSTARHNRQYHVDLLLSRISETREIARIAGNATAMAACDKNYAAVVEKFMGEKETPEFDTLQVPDHIFVFDPALLPNKTNIDEQELNRRMEKLKQVKPASHIQDIGFEEVENG